MIMMKRFLILAAFCLAALPSAAQNYNYQGTVYGVYPEGVMIQQGTNSYLVPNQNATFELGGLRATWSSLVPGQSIRAYVPQTYIPNVRVVQDPYAWKVKYHPDHPHGGPPGQTKKYYQNGQGNNGNNGNGKNKAKYKNKGK